MIFRDSIEQREVQFTERSASTKGRLQPPTTVTEALCLLCPVEPPHSMFEKYVPVLLPSVTNCACYAICPGYKLRVSYSVARPAPLLTDAFSWLREILPCRHLLRLLCPSKYTRLRISGVLPFDEREV